MKQFFLGLGLCALPMFAYGVCMEYEPASLQDVTVYETVTGRQFTTNEIMAMLDRLPNVKTVSRKMVPRYFSAADLAYPQNARHYQIGQKEWAELQAYCKEQLAEGRGADEVKAHWQRIVDGKPPFGLQVQKD